MEVSAYRDRLAVLLKDAPALGGVYYRAVPPDGAGSALEPGYSFQGGNRYNPPGVLSALYFSDNERRAPLEANLPYRHEIWEMTIADLGGVVRLDERTLGRIGLDRLRITKLRMEVQAYRECQAVGLGAFQAGASGLLFPSALPGAIPDSWNLAVFPAALVRRAAVSLRRVA